MPSSPSSQTAPSSPQPPSGSPASSLPLLLSTVLGSSLAFIDGSIVNVALPTIGRQLGASAGELSWVVEAYLLMVASLILVAGALGDRYGYRRIFGLGVLIFTVASVLCALSSNTLTLILARALQGVGGALLTPNSLALLSAHFSGEARGRAIGTWSALTGVAGVIGPLLGGWLIGVASWQSAFWINVPLAGVVLLTLWRFVPADPPIHDPRPIDLPGAVLATLGLGGLVFGLIETGTRGLGALESWLPIGLGTLLLTGFLVWQARAAHPMLPLRLFRSRLFSGANLLTFVVYGALGAVGYFVPLNLMQVQGFTPLEAGAALLPMTVLLALLSRPFGALAARHGPRTFLTLGPLLLGAGFALLALPGVGVGYAAFVPAILAMGLGLALLVSPLTATVFASVDREQSGIASGINTAVARAAALIAIAGLGLIVSSGFSSALDRRLEAARTPPELRRTLEAGKSRLAALEVPRSVEPQRRTALEQDIRESYVQGFRMMVLWAALLAALGAVIGWFSSVGRSMPQDHSR